MERKKVWGVHVRGLHLVDLGVVPIISAHISLVITQSYEPIQLTSMSNSWPVGHMQPAGRNFDIIEQRRLGNICVLRRKRN